MPALDILESIVALIPNKYLHGIRSIVLFDEAYDSSRDKIVGARYVSLSGTTRADIYIFFQRYDMFNEVLRENKIYLTYSLSKSLLHELYHHASYTLKLTRKKEDKEEEQNAEKWGKVKSDYIISKIYPYEKHREEYDEIKKLEREGVKEFKEPAERGEGVREGVSPII